jgi:hypothetical protein
MIAKLDVLVFCGVLIAVVAIVLGRSTRVLVFDLRSTVLLAALAILALIYLYWKSRPA